MLSVNDRINKIRDALIAIDTIPTIAHYWRAVETAPYCIWYEDAEDGALQSDGHKQEQAITGSVDYFTKTENDPNIDRIQDALNTVSVCIWELESVQYEEETNLIHYTWNWTVA